MPTQTFKGGTVLDIEAALLEQYGRTNVKEQTITDSRAEWRFQINSKSHGMCVAMKTPDGVTMTMSPSTHTFVWVVTVIGYLACIIPGIAMTIWILMARTVTAGVLSHRFPKMVEAVQRAVASHSASPPPLS